MPLFQRAWKSELQRKVAKRWKYKPLSITKCIVFRNQRKPMRSLRTQKPRCFRQTSRAFRKFKLSLESKSKKASITPLLPTRRSSLANLATNPSSATSTSSPWAPNLRKKLKKRSRKTSRTPWLSTKKNSRRAHPRAPRISILTSRLNTNEKTTRKWAPTEKWEFPWARNSWTPTCWSSSPKKMNIS